MPDDEKWIPLTSTCPKCKGKWATSEYDKCPVDGAKLKKPKGGK